MATEVSQREYTVAELESQLSGEDEWIIAPPRGPSEPPLSTGDPFRSASSSKRKGRKVKRRLSKQEIIASVPDSLPSEQSRYIQGPSDVPFGAPSRRKTKPKAVERTRSPTPVFQPPSVPASLVVTGKRIRKPKLTHEDFFAYEQDLLPSQHVSIYNPQIIAEAFEKGSSSKRKGKPKKAMIGYDDDDASDETVVLMQPVDDGPTFPPEITWSSALVCTFPGCTKRCSKKHHLDAHMRTHLGEKPFQCPQPGCGKWYSRLYHLKAHSRSHTGEKPFRCTFPSCKWTFARSDKLARHNLKHTGIKSFACTVCDKRFARADHLSRHLGRQHVHKTLLS